MNTPNALPRNHQRARCTFVVLSLSCLLAAPSALAQENKNLALSDGNWSDPNAWSPSGVPLAEDSIVNTGVNSRIIRLDSTETDANKQANPFRIANITNNSTSTMSVRTLSGTGNQWLNVTGNVVQDSTGTLEFMNVSQLNVTVDGNVDVLQGTLSLGSGTTAVNNFTVTGLTTVKSGALLDMRHGSRPFFNGGVELEAGSNMRHVNPNAAASFPRDTFSGLRGSGTFTVQNTDTTNRVNLMRFFQDSGTWDYAGNIVMDQQSTGALTTQLTRNGTDGAQILRGSIGNHSGATTIFGGVLAFAGDATLTSGNIQLNNTNSGAGSILGVSSTMTRSLGSGAGAIRLSGESAGFAAYDNDATVSLGASVVWDASNFTMTNLVLGHSSADSKVTLSSAIDLGDTTRSVVVHNGSAAVDGVLSGVLSGTGGFTKTGDGVLELSGNNTYSGALAVQAGVLALASTVGGAAAASSSVSVASGATLLLSQSDQVNNAAAVTLSGGTITRGTGVSEVFGNLNLTTGSFLDFGTGSAGTIGFGTYTPSALTALNIVNFTTGNTLIFKSDLSSSIETSAFVFSGSGGLGDYSWDSDTSTFTITAIPEASTFVAAAGLLAVLVWPARRRLLKDTKSLLGLRFSP
jgi:autotransporter-associated beta strand protein